MLNRISKVTLTALAGLTLSADCFAQQNLAAKARRFQLPPARVVVESDRIKDGLAGPVRRVRTEVVKLSSTEGKVVEGKRALLEVVAYDVKGNKIENQYYPIAGATLTGKEVYKYDDKGNISEMTLLNDDGSLLGKESYKYEFDFAGNWNKMTTAVAVVDGGKVSLELTEVTYRSIMYYLDGNMVKIAQPGTQPGISSRAPSSSTSNAATTQPAREALSSNNPPARVQKSVSALPNPSIVADDMSVRNSAELTSVTTNSITPSGMVVLEAEPPPTPEPKPLLKPVSGGVLNGTSISLPTPKYPEAAKRMKVFGVVTVAVVIDEAGNVIAAHASGGPATLKEAAVQAALKARFSPTKLSGQPVKVSGVINYKFSLSQ